MLIETAFKTPFGWLNMAFDEHYIYRSFFTETPHSQQPATQQSLLITEQLSAYFENCHHRFQLPLKPHGTHYQQRVWNALLVIPVGRTITYGELAKTLQSSPRAIGQACKNNPVALFIPCHRVVGKTNQGGYMGKPEAIYYKKSLLNHEGIFTIP